MKRLSQKSHLVLVEKYRANGEVSSSRKGWSITRSRWGLILRVSLCFRSHPRPQVLPPLLHSLFQILSQHPPPVSPSPIPSISCFEAGAILIPTVGQHGSVPLARPPPAAAVREPLPRRTLLRKSSETLGDMENLTSCIQPSCYTAKNLSIK